MGRDDNKSTGLSGATGALKAWLGFMAETSHVPLAFEAPPGVQYAWVDDTTGLLSSENCDGARYVPFLEGTAPTEQGASCNPLNGLKQWFQNLF
jgi:penicillin-binding protein 1B